MAIQGWSWSRSQCNGKSEAGVVGAEIKSFWLRNTAFWNIGIYLYTLLLSHVCHKNKAFLFACQKDDAALGSGSTLEVAAPQHCRTQCDTVECWLHRHYIYLRSQLSSVETSDRRPDPYNNSYGSRMRKFSIRIQGNFFSFFLSMFYKNNFSFVVPCQLLYIYAYT